MGNSQEGHPILRFQRVILKWFPKYLFTILLGYFARSSFSKYFISFYIKFYNIDVTELDRPIAEYRNLLDFFCRQLKPVLRPIHQEGIVSPVDGCVSDCGDIEEDCMILAKGVRYTLSALLGDSSTSTFQGGQFIVLYLSPRDYHRIHMPYDGTCIRCKYIPGAFYPVNAWGNRAIGELFSKNERIVTEVKVNAQVTIDIVMVGALGVGSIHTKYYHRPRHKFLRTNLFTSEERICYTYSRGEEIGRFEFGSTVILLFPPGFIGTWTVKPGQSVKMGMQIAKF